MDSRILIIFISLILSACVYYPSKQAQSILEVDTVNHKKCTLVGQVYGDAPTMPYLAMGLDIAKDKAKEQASSIGANKIVWTEVNSRGAPIAKGKAYYCKP